MKARSLRQQYTNRFIDVTRDYSPLPPKTCVTVEKNPEQFITVNEFEIGIKLRKISWSKPGIFERDLGPISLIVIKKYVKPVLLTYGFVSELSTIHVLFLVVHHWLPVTVVLDYIMAF